MASIWKRPGSKYLVACFTDAQGKQRKRSTETTSRRKALRMAEVFEQAARTKRTAAQARRVLADLHRELTGGEALEGAKVKEYVETWLKRKKPEVAASTHEFYSQQLGRFVEWLGPKATGDLNAVTKSDVTDFRSVLLEHLAPRSANQSMKALRALFRDAKREGMVDEEVTEVLRSAKVSTDTGRRPFTADELRRVMAAADDEWRSLITFGYHTGQRLSDLTLLTWEAIDQVNWRIRIRTKKTQRLLVLPVSASLQQHIKSLKAPSDPKSPLHPRAFSSVQRTGRVNQLSNAFADILRAAGLRKLEEEPEAKGAGSKKKPGKGEPKAVAGHGRRRRRQLNDLSFHSLRHTATSLLKAAGLPAATVQGYVGHSSAAISSLYTHVDEISLRQAAESLPALPQ